jgi:hypothetical protein
LGGKFRKGQFINEDLFRLTMMGIKDKMAGRGVDSPRISCESTTLNAGSRVFTVCVREMATAAKEMFAAI